MSANSFNIGKARIDLELRKRNLTSKMFIVALFIVVNIGNNCQQSRLE